MGPDVLRGLEADQPCLVVPVYGVDDSDVVDRLRGRRAVIGPMMAVTEAGRALAVARRAMALRSAGVLPDTPVVRCADHLTDRLLVAEPLIVDQLAMQTLGVNRQHSLRQQGSTSGIAEELGVHPQTVRYWTAQLREVFGDRLDARTSASGCTSCSRPRGCWAARPTPPHGVRRSSRPRLRDWTTPSSPESFGHVR